MMTDSVIHVLSIEDNPADAELIQEKLAQAQQIGWDLPRFEVEHVARLEPALERLEDSDFDVVLSDLDLPDSRAGETVATLREHIPQMPLVVLTGREDEVLAQKSVRAGVQDYLYKNEATGSLLARTLMYAIERQQTHGELERRVEKRTAELRQVNEALRAEIAEREQTEEALRESEARFRLAVLHSGIIFAQTDRDLRYTWVYNPHPDFVPQFAIGKRDDELADNEGTRQLMCMKQKVLDTGQKLRQDITFPLSGGTRTYDTMAEPMRDDAGDVIGVATCALDITERKQAEDALPWVIFSTARARETPSSWWRRSARWRKRALCNAKGSGSCGPAPRPRRRCPWACRTSSSSGWAG